MSNTIRKVPKEEKGKKEIREDNSVCQYCGGNRAEINMGRNMKVCYQCAVEMGIES